MKTKRIIISWLLAGVIMSWTACTSENPMTLQEKLENDYTISWIKDFGIIDSNQDWNMATQVTVDLSSASLDQGCYVELYSSNPLGGGKYLGRITNENPSVKVDLVKGATSIYLKIKDGDGETISCGYIKIDRDKVTYAKARASRDADCTVTHGDVFVSSYRVQDSSYNLEEAAKVEDDHYWEPNSEWKWVNYKGEIVDKVPEGDYTIYNKWRLVKQSFAHLNNTTTSTVSEYQIKDMIPIVGSDGKFEEGVNNRALYWDVFQHDVMFKAKAFQAVGGPIEVTYQFGGTAYKNVFAYYYWQDDEDPMSAVKYILMEDGLPQHNVFLNDAETQVTDGMSWPNIISMVEAGTYASDRGPDAYMVGTKYNLVYFDENGVASYDFPNGTNIAFVMISYGNSSDNFPQDSEYAQYMLSSVSDHNAQLGKYYDSENGIGEVAAVTYKADGTIVLGFEDGTDKDMNDILMLVNGVDGSEIIEVIAEVNDPQSWLIACEDLGSTGDYDFNDIVFKVSHVVGETYVVFTPLAAGGVYAANVYHNNVDLGEIHNLLDGTTAANGSYPMLNTSSYTSSSTNGTITVGEDFSITDNMGGFSIVVTGKETTITIHAPNAGTAPQMMCLPGDWKWPKEYTDIRTAYPNFKNWSEDSESTDWINTVTSGSVIEWY
ncbi:MAG: LruC domain-containing protein [Bacteroidales bacterium]|nr:LruC domain-containing protein [Bacteroidales bacterium]